MPKITDIKVQKGDPERVSLYIDGHFAFGVSAMIALARRLHAGMEVTRSELDALQHDDVAERAYSSALNLLSFRPRSSREVQEHLQKKKFDAEIVEAVIQKLQRASLVDDRQFARFWVENRQTFRPRGARALRAELRQKGLAAGDIDDALEGLGNEETTAYDVGLKKSRSYQGYGEREYVNKMTTFLQRKGFSYNVCASVARQLWTRLDNESAGGDDE